MCLLFVISIGIDLLWFFVIYLRVLTSDDYHNLANWESGIHTTVLVVGIANLVVKAISIVVSVLFDPEVRLQTMGNNPGFLGTQVR